MKKLKRNILFSLQAILLGNLLMFQTLTALQNKIFFSFLFLSVFVFFLTERIVKIVVLKSSE